MSSGRRESVLVFCASPFKELYVPSVDHYGPDRVYVFVSTRDDAVSVFERDLLRSMRDVLDCPMVTEVPVDTRDYNAVLGELMDIKAEMRERFGDDLDLYINVSSGTPEFAAAATFASMLPPQAVAFRVDLAHPDLTPDAVAEMVRGLEGRLVPSEPVRITGLRNDSPDREMVVFLRTVSGLLKGTRSPRYALIIDLLKDAGVWSYDPQRKSGSGRTTLAQREERYLKRHYIEPAVENGWLERPSVNTMRLTERGETYVDVFDIGLRRGYANRSVQMCSSAIGSCYDDYNLDADPGLDFCRPSAKCAAPPEEHGPEDSVVTIEGRHGRRYVFRIGEE
ncbi:MAG: DUF6293 family protein [archaeon]|nr:DUF6293 family protein [archaeon]